MAASTHMDAGMSLVPHRSFGRLALRASVLGLGTVKWGRNQKLHYAPFELPADQTLDRLLATAVECGINVLDTAPAYGMAEERVGRLLSQRQDSFIVIAKAGEEFEQGESRYDFSAESIRRSLERSLRRLQRESLDLVLLHCPPDDLPVIENSPALETLADMKSKGWIRYYGVSSMTLKGGLKGVDLSDAVMVAWNYRYRDQEEVILKAGREGKAVLLKKALLSGNLGTSPAPGRSVIETCVASALDMGAVSSLIAGTIDCGHLVENARAAAAWNRGKKSGFDGVLPHPDILPPAGRDSVEP